MKITIHEIVIKDPVSWVSQKTGKSGQRWDIGIKRAEGWINGNAWTEKDATYFKGLKKSETIDLIVFEEKGTGKYEGQTFKKFRLPTKEDKMLDNIVSLGNSLKDHEKRLKALEDKPKSYGEKLEEIKQTEQDLQKEREDDLPF